MPALSAARRFCAVVLIAAALFTLTGADPAGSWPGPLAFVFWLTSVGAGLGLALVAAAVLARRPAWARRPRWLTVAASGALGLLLFTPLALALDGVFPPPPASPDDWLDMLEARGLGDRLLAELLQAGPAYLLTWGLINVAVPWPQARAPRPAATPAVAPGTPVLGAGEVRPAMPQAPTPPSPPGPRTGSEPAAARPAVVASLAAATTAADALGWPRALGDEVLHVQADLHYLQVTTALGRAMVLGSLAAVEAHFGDQGLRVHRSHWVALRAVRGVRRTGEGWVVDLPGGASVPVSRRRVAQVRERLGVDFRRGER